MNLIKPLLVCSSMAMAFNTVAAPNQLEETIVTASPHGKPVKDIAGGVNLLTGEVLKRELAATLGETLQNQLGVQSAAFGSGVGVPVIRGFSGKRVEVLQNSNRVADVSDTSPDHAVATEALLADSIEILRGPAALRFGAGAIGGVVNVVDNRIHSKRHEGFSGAAEYRFDTNNNERVTVVRVDAGKGVVGLHVDGVLRDSADIEIPSIANRQDPSNSSYGKIMNSDAEADTWSAGLSLVGDKVFGGVSINQLNNNYGIPPESRLDDELVRIDLEQTLYQAQLTVLEPLIGFEQFELNIGATDYEHKELEIEEGEVHTGTVFSQSAYSIRAELQHQAWGAWLGTWGLDYNERDFSAVGAEAFVPSSTTEQTALYIIEERALGDFNLELGARYDRQNIDSVITQKHHSLNLSANVLWPFSENQRLALLLSKVERAPVAEELLAVGEHIATASYIIGDASLANESATNLELGWRYQAIHEATINLFYTDFSDYLYEANTGLSFSESLANTGNQGLNACSNQIVDFGNDLLVKNAALPCYQYQQQTVKFVGIEAELRLNLSDAHSLRVWGDSVRSEFDQGDDVPRIPADRLGFNWDYQQGAWFAGLSASHYFSQHRVGFAEASASSYTRVDAYASYHRAQWEVFVKGTNLEDVEIRSATNLLRERAPEKGRSVVLGVSYRFGGGEERYLRINERGNYANF